VTRTSARARTQRGVAAVEAGLISTVLMPLLLGVLVYGNYFWHAQKVDAYAARIPSGAIQGAGLTCEQLVERVKDTVVASVNSLAEGAGIDESDVAVQIVEVLPTVGAVVSVSVSVPVVSSLASILPNGGSVVTDTLVRLDNVTLTTTSC
jgi:hypothetical protein